MAIYEILTGQRFSVEAESEDQAMAKYGTYDTSDPCPCGKSDCSCVMPQEVDTWVQRV